MKKRKKLFISIFSIFAFVLSIFSFNLFKNANAMAIDNSISTSIDDIELYNVDGSISYSFSPDFLSIGNSVNNVDLDDYSPVLRFHFKNGVISHNTFDFVLFNIRLNAYFTYYDSNDESIFYQDYSNWYVYTRAISSGDYYLNESYLPFDYGVVGSNITAYFTSLIIDTSATNYGSDVVNYIDLHFDFESYANSNLFTSFIINIMSVECYTYSTSYSRSQFDNSIDTFYNEGYNNGYSSGYNNGYDLGYNNGNNIGYSSGYNVGVNEYKTLYDNLVVQYNDLQDLYNDYLDGNVSFNTLVWNIATIPFESFKQIWNVDLLGLNIGNFVTALMFVGVVVFIWKKFL